jgi:hypothetical protein
MPFGVADGPTDGPFVAKIPLAGCETIFAGSTAVGPLRETEGAAIFDVRLF